MISGHNQFKKYVLRGLLVMLIDNILPGCPHCGSKNYHCVDQWTKDYYDPDDQLDCNGDYPVITLPAAIFRCDDCEHVWTEEDTAAEGLIHISDLGG